MQEAHISDASLIDHTSEDRIFYLGEKSISEYLANDNDRETFIKHLISQFTDNTGLKNRLTNDFDRLEPLASQMKSQIRKETLKQVIDENLSEDAKTEIAAQQAKARQVLSAERELGGLTKEAWIKEKIAQYARSHTQQLSETSSEVALSQMFSGKQIPSDLMNALNKHPNFKTKEGSLPSYTIRFVKNGAPEEIPIERFIEDYIDQSTSTQGFLTTQENTLAINSLPNNVDNAKESLIGHLRSTPNVLEFNCTETNKKIQEKKEAQVQEALKYIDTWCDHYPSRTINNKNPAPILQVFHLSDQRILKKLLSLMTQEPHPYPIYQFSLNILEALYDYLREKNGPTNKQLFILLSIALHKELLLSDETSEENRNTYIQVASRYGNIDILKQISPQHWATPNNLATVAIAGHHEIVDRILDAPSLQMENYSAYSLLLKTLIDEANIKDAVAIIDHYTEKKISLAPNNVQALLLQAICLKHFSIVSALLNYLTTVKKETQEAWNTPAFREQWLQAILKSNSSNTLELFWAKELLSPKEIMHFAKNKGLLDQAIRQGKDAIAETLLLSERSPLFLEHNSDKNVLRLAIQCQRTETVKTLLQRNDVKALLKVYPKRYKKLAIQHSSWETLIHNETKTTIAELEDIIKKKTPPEVVGKFLSNLPKNKKIPLKLLHIAMEHSAYKSVVETLLQGDDIQDQIRKMPDKKLHLKLLNAALREYPDVLSTLLKNSPINEHSVIAAAKTNVLTTLNRLLSNKKWSNKVQTKLLKAAASQCNTEMISSLLNLFNKGLTPDVHKKVLHKTFFEAIREGKSTSTLFLFNSIHEQNFSDKELYTSALCLSIEKHDQETFHALMEKVNALPSEEQKKILNAKSKLGAKETPLQAAIFAQNDLAFKHLLDKEEVDITTTRQSDRKNILHFSLNQSSTAYLDAILAKIGSENFPQEKKHALFYPKRVTSPLTHALRLGKIDRIIKLLEAGIAPKKAEDYRHLRKIIFPAGDSSVKILQLLKERCSFEEFKQFVNAKRRGFPLLSEAIYYSTELNNPIANELLGEHQDPRLIIFSKRYYGIFADNNHGKNCIMLAIEQGNPIILKKILQKAQRHYNDPFNILINCKSLSDNYSTRQSPIKIALNKPESAACFPILLAYNPILESNDNGIREEICSDAARCYRSNPALLDALLDKLECTENGLNEESKQLLLYTRDSQGRTVLDILGNILPPTHPTLARLIRHGAVPNASLLNSLCTANQGKTLQSLKESSYESFKPLIDKKETPLTSSLIDQLSPSLVMQIFDRALKVKSNSLILALLGSQTFYAGLVSNPQKVADIEKKLSSREKANPSAALMSLYSQRKDTLFRGAHAVEAGRGISHNPRRRAQI